MTAKKFLTPEIKNFRLILNKLESLEKLHEWPDSEREKFDALREYLLLQIAISKEKFLESKSTSKKHTKPENRVKVAKKSSKLAKGSIMSGLIGKTSSRNWKKVK